MIYILHGDNLVSTRKTLENLQKKHSVTTKTELSISETTASDFSNLCRSVDMFGGVQFIVLDISGAGRMNMDAYAQALGGIPTQSIVVILSSKELGKTNVFIKQAGELKATVLLSKEFDNSNVFKFVDLLFAGNRTGAYKELQKLLDAEQDPFYIFSMMQYQLRNIAYAKYKSPLVNKIAPFAKDKAQKLAEKYTEEGLMDIYSRFYKLDKDVKYGSTSQELFLPFAIESVLKNTTV